MQQKLFVLISLFFMSLASNPGFATTLQKGKALIHDVHECQSILDGGGNPFPRGKALSMPWNDLIGVWTEVGSELDIIQVTVTPLSSTQTQFVVRLIDTISQSTIALGIKIASDHVHQANIVLSGDGITAEAKFSVRALKGNPSCSQMNGFFVEITSISTDRHTTIKHTAILNQLN